MFIQPQGKLAKKMQKWPATNMDLSMHLLGTTTCPQQ